MYTPTGVSIAMFTQCEVKALLKAEEDCGCSLNNLPHPNEPFSGNEQQADLKLKTDWKFVVESKYNWATQNNHHYQPKYFVVDYNIYALLFAREIFHPPNAVA